MNGTRQSFQKLEASAPFNELKLRLRQITLVDAHPQSDFKGISKILRFRQWEEARL